MTVKKPIPKYPNQMWVFEDRVEPEYPRKMRKKPLKKE